MQQPTRGITVKQYSIAALLGSLSVVASAQSTILSTPQSTVTLFGIVDAGVREVKNGNYEEKFLSSNGLTTTRLGFSGTTDLGNGNSAGFWLEAGFNPANGTQSDTTRFFNRRSTVSLISQSLGEVRLGRDYSPTYRGYVDYDEFFDNGVAASSKFDSSLGTARLTGTRADNEISYFTPTNLGGFFGRVSVAAPQGVVGAKYAGGLAGFAQGAFKASVAYGQTTVAKAAGEELFKTWDAGASYDFKVVQVQGYYTDSKYGSLERRNASIGASSPVGPVIIRAQYTHSTASGTTAAHVNTNANTANQYALGVIYSASKSTTLYATAAAVRNKGAANFAVAATAVTPAGGGWDSSGYEAGVRYSF